MNRRYTHLMILISIAVGLSLVAFASSPVPNPPQPNPSWFEHVDLMQIIIGCLFLAVLWFFIRTLKKIDANQALLFQKVDALCADFYELRGEHNAIKNRCRQ